MSRELTTCQACGNQTLAQVEMEIPGFKICSICYCTQLPWSKLQTVKRELFFNSRKKWASALASAPNVELNPQCELHSVPMTLQKIREYGSMMAWQDPAEDCELMIIEPVVMAEILAGSTEVREEFTSSKYKSKAKWNPLAFVGVLFASKKDEDIDDLFEDIQFQRKIAPCLGLKD